MCCIVPNKSPSLCCQWETTKRQHSKTFKHIIMKTKNNNLLIQLDKSSMEQLTAEVKETLAKEVKTAAKQFSAADLWKIRNMRRISAQRLHLA